jgi:hypothetical protein
MAVSKEVQRQQADRLEELLIAGKEIVRLLRESQDDRFAYALLYLLRGELGVLVRSSRVAVPSNEHMKKAAEVIDSQVWNFQGRDKKS